MKIFYIDGFRLELMIGAFLLFASACVNAEALEGSDWTIDISEQTPATIDYAELRGAVELSDGRIVATSSSSMAVITTENTLESYSALSGISTDIVAAGENAVLAWAPSSDGCDIGRFSTEGVLRWRQRYGSATCENIVIGNVEENIVLWQSSQSMSAERHETWISALSAVGSEIWRSEALDNVEGSFLIRDDSSSLVYLIATEQVSSDENFEPLSLIHVVAYSLDGERLWQWRSDSAYRRVSTVTKKPRGGLLIAVRAQDFPAHEGTALLHFDAQGHRLAIEPETPISPEPNEIISIDVVESIGNRTYMIDTFNVFSNFDFRIRIRGLGDDGTNVWGREVQGDFLSQKTKALNNGDLLVVSTDDASEVSMAQRFDAEGNLMFSTSIGFMLSVHEIVETADGRLAILGSRAEGDEAVIILGPSGGLAGELIAPLLSRLPRTYGVQVHAGIEGTGVYWIGDDDRINAVGNDGLPIWHKQLSRLPYTSHSVGLQYAGMAACGMGWLCATDWTARAFIEIDELTGVERSRWQPVKTQIVMIPYRLADDSLTLINFFPGGPFTGQIPALLISELPAGGGTVPESQYVERLGVLAVSDQGTTLRVGSTLQLVSADGSVQPYAPDIDPGSVVAHRGDLATFTLPGLLDADYTATVHTGTCSAEPNISCAAIEVTRLGREGRRWSVPTEAPPATPFNLISRQLLSDDEGNVYSLLAFADATFDTHQIYLTSVTTDGELRWRRRWTQSGSGAAQIFLSPDKGALTLAWNRVGTTDKSLVAIDAETGHIRNEHALSCSGAACEKWNVDIGDDGTVIAAGLGLEYGVVQGRYGLLDEAATIRLDQSGLNGAWYAPRSDGQGFALRYFPESRTWFMPWFTYSAEGGNEPSELRWYALQGDVEPGATEATLTIIERMGGVFGLEPADPLAVVGEAKLRFFSCDEGLLDFEFDSGVNEGKAGTIRLNPLLPRGNNCIDADDSVVPAVGRYDARLTGSWYNPGADGQGLELFRIAPEQNDPGLLYAAWFTFDPEEGSGEAGDQHWFTLQGQQILDGGIVRSTIVQTLGGRLDSEPTRNAFRVGEVDLVSQSCEQLTLRYRFDDADIAEEFRGRSGEIALHRLGGCPVH